MSLTTHHAALPRCLAPPPSVISLALRAYLRLERYDDAEKLARRGIKSEKKKCVKVDCHIVLGRIAAAKSDLTKAEEQFKLALSEAITARLPLLEVVVARELLHFVLEGTGRETEAVAVIQQVCEKTGTPVDELDCVEWYDLLE